MRKLVLFVHISLDGFAGGPQGELDWISYDEEIQKYADGIVGSVGSPLYGRVTYGMMEGYWPTVLRDPASHSKHEVDHARWIERIDKVVFSRTLEKTEWTNTLIIRGNVKEEIIKLKQQPGKDLVVFGSPGLARTLLELNLVDQFQLTLNPVLLGKGTPLFQGIVNPLPLKLLKATTLPSGVIGLHYERKV